MFYFQVFVLPTSLIKHGSLWKVINAQYGTKNIKSAEILYHTVWQAYVNKL